MSDVELPPGWARVRLEEIAEVRLGRQRSPKNHSGNQMRPYLRAANVDWKGLKLDDVKEMNFTDSEMETYRLLPGDIVLSEASGSAGEVGKPALWNGQIDECCFQNTLIRVRAASGVEPRYLLHVLRYEALRGAFAEGARGVGIHHLGAAKLTAWQVPLPPIAEQHRIVEALEHHLSRLDAAQSSLILSSRRSAHLLQRLIANALDTDPKKSRETTLGAVATSVKNGIFVSRPSIDPSGVPILRIGAVRPLKLDTSDIRFTALPGDSDKLVGALLNPGDLLFTRYNGNPEYVGACAMVPHDTGPLTYPDKLIRVVVNREQVIPEYAALACTAGPGRQYIRQHAKTTAGQAGISGRELKGVPLALPSLEEQQRRVEEYRTAATAVGLLHDGIDRARTRSPHLRQALLYRAFTGQLVPQDPADEPASVLLDRIRAERATQSKPKRTPRPRKSTPPPPPPAASTPLPTNAVQQEFEL